MAVAECGQDDLWALECMGTAEYGWCTAQLLWYMGIAYFGIALYGSFMSGSLNVYLLQGAGVVVCGIRSVWE